ncbi:MAG: mandelate racemase/muconate lactonizing enzyme family protein [Saprospiraceae bacterium]|nr:mandelate racemase/muconate lactonizing enzyme family protein [Saprospiraceae bacterium]
MKKSIDRRTFMQNTSGVLASCLIGTTCVGARGLTGVQKLKQIKIEQVGANFEREQLIPYRFKGGATTDKWTGIACLKSESGIRKVGLGPQGTLWSDGNVARAHTEAGANALMFSISEYALQLIKGETFTDPIQLQEHIFPEVYAYAKQVTQNPELSKTFALNALVSVDNAAWLLFAAENNFATFDDMVPAQFRQGIGEKHKGVASIPSFPTGTKIEKLVAAVDAGFFVLKLKIGAAGTQEEMLDKDKQFMTELHRAIGSRETKYTSNGKIPYYFDANGRYHKKETLLRLLDHAKKIRAFDQIAVLEEPFPEPYEANVGDMGVRVASDESCHTVEEAERRIEMGYNAFAVKAIAKTLSMTLKIAQLAYEKGIPCFCADLTVGPILAEWNKNIAARLPLFPGVGVGLQETNGHQYYKEWDKLMSYHPSKNAEWVVARDGVFHTGASFYEQSGGIFMPSDHYEAMFEHL